MHVESSGQGPDLLLLHGWGMNASVWSELAPALALHFRVHCIDLPGHGASAMCAPYTLDGVVRALAARLPARVTVCGWSLGAQIALVWARSMPLQVSRLVLIAATPRFVNGAGWSHGVAAGALDAFAADLQRDAAATLARFVALQAQGDDDTRDVLRYLRARACAGPAPDGEALAAGLRILRDSDLRDLLPHVRQPALILQGARDALVPPAAGRFLARALPAATLETMAGAAHAPFATRAARTALSIEEFCRAR